MDVEFQRCATRTCALFLSRRPAIKKKHKCPFLSCPPAFRKGTSTPFRLAHLPFKKMQVPPFLSVPLPFKKRCNHSSLSPAYVRPSAFIFSCPAPGCSKRWKSPFLSTPLPFKKVEVPLLSRSSASLQVKYPFFVYPPRLSKKRCNIFSLSPAYVRPSAFVQTRHSNKALLSISPNRRKANCQEVYNIYWPRYYTPHHG